MALAQAPRAERPPVTVSAVRADAPAWSAPWAAAALLATPAQQGARQAPEAGRPAAAEQLAPLGAAAKAERLGAGRPQRVVPPGAAASLVSTDARRQPVAREDEVAAAEPLARPDAVELLPAPPWEAAR